VRNKKSLNEKVEVCREFRSETNNVRHCAPEEIDCGMTRISTIVSWVLQQCRCCVHEPLMVVAKVDGRMHERLATERSHCDNTPVLLFFFLWFFSTRKDVIQWC